MSDEEHNEYMRDVKWKTFWYIAFIAGGMIISGTYAWATIRSDISDLKTDQRINNREMRHYVDSIHHDDLKQFDDIWLAMKGIYKDSVLKFRNNGNNAQLGCFIEKIVKGKKVFIPVDCQYK